VRTRGTERVDVVMGRASPPVLELQEVRKHYGGLRPLRINDLEVREGERVAMSGFDAAAAEMLISLLTGASLPDEGDIRVLGESTAAIADEEAWLASLDRIGVVSLRAVLLSGSTLAQNLAIPFTLEIDPVPTVVMAQVRALAEEVGLPPDQLDVPAGAAPPQARVRVHLARALASGPRVLLLEHPTAMLPPEATPAFGMDLARVAEARAFALLAVTEDARFAGIVAGRRLALDPASGALTEPHRWPRWWSGWR